MNREQMIAWLILEGIELYVAPILGDKDGRQIWSVRDRTDELQRYTDKPDTWDRYDNFSRHFRVPADMTDLRTDVLRELYEAIRDHREGSK